MAVVTCPTSGPISIANVKAAFPTTNSNNLNAYRGKQWFKDNNDRGFFPGNNSAISLSDFYGKRENSPVVAGSATYTSGSSITLPALFNTLTVEVYGGGGGGGGGCVLHDVYIHGDGGSGGTGGTTSFGTSGTFYYASASGGPGGGGGGVNTNGTPGTNGNGPVGGGGGGAGVGSVSVNYFPYVFAGGSGASGGNGNKLIKIAFDITSLGYSAISVYYGSSIPISIGGPGSAGSPGAANWDNTIHYAYAGFQGGAGYIVISWT